MNYNQDSLTLGTELGTFQLYNLKREQESIVLVDGVHGLKRIKTRISVDTIFNVSKEKIIKCRYEKIVTEWAQTDTFDLVVFYGGPGIFKGYYLSSYPGDGLEHIILPNGNIYSEYWIKKSGYYIETNEL